MKDVVLAVEIVMHGLVFRRLPREKSMEAFSKSEAHSIACRFRQKLCLSLITTARKNPTIGVDRVFVGDEASGIPRPKWLRNVFVRKSPINDVLSKDDVSTSKVRGAPVIQGLEGGTEAMSEEAVERQTLGEEIVKMVNQRNVQHMNKSRGFARNAFFIETVFLRHGELSPVFLSSLVSSLMLFNFGEMPCPSLRFRNPEGMKRHVPRT